MSNSIYKIRNLVCSYNGKTPILKIDTLNLEKGKLIVIVGKSGAGKSTILETLGLMNKTIIDGEMIFYPNEDNSINITELWENEELLSNVRNDYLSFIFQDTNLMNNFTAYENACIPLLMQGIGFEQSIKEVKLAMDMVGLQEITDESKVAELSGGQRQRLAFVRAITSSFAVLFGDEPTGNLDENNSRELMKIFKENIKEKNRTSIIVSHDIDLALEFADQIIMMVKEREYGEIRSENIYNCDAVNNRIWKNSNGNEAKSIKELLHTKLK